MNLRSGGSIGCLGLFLLPFAAVGTFMFYLILSDLHGWIKMQSWKEVPARIVRAELETHHDSDGGTTWKAKADYEYVYNDQRYTGSRVSRYGGSDNIGGFQRDIYSEISQYQNSEKPFQCYVNPEAPHESILYRNARLGMVMFYSLFALFFGGFGYGLFAGLLVSLVQNRRSSALAKHYPAQPWMHRHDWSRGEARNSAGLKVILSIAIAIFISLLCLPVLVYVPGEMRDGHYSGLLALLFPAIGILIVSWAVRSLLAWKRFGSSVLQLQTNPVKPGGRLRGFLKTGANLPESANIELELKCEKTIKTRSGRKTSYNTDTVWTNNSTGMGVAGMDGKTSIQIDIPIPENLPSTADSEGSGVKWILIAKSDIPGVDLNVTFEIPVFN